jgi:hypothetical protein
MNNAEAFDFQTLRAALPAIDGTVDDAISLEERIRRMLFDHASPMDTRRSIQRLVNEHGNKCLSCGARFPGGSSGKQELSDHVVDECRPYGKELRSRITNFLRRNGVIGARDKPRRQTARELDHPPDIFPTTTADCGLFSDLSMLTICYTNTEIREQMPLHAQKEVVDLCLQRGQLIKLMSGRGR